MTMPLRSEDPAWSGAPGGSGGQRIAERLGPYRLVHQIGEGGMGVVYLALDPHGRAVAIKVLRPHVAYDSEARARLERELHTLTRIRNDRVAAVIDADVFGPRPYLVTRYVPGPPLDEVVAEHGPRRGEDLVRLGRGLIGALEAIHGAGVIHRDLKPGNVLLEDDVDPVVIDFGIAHVADDIRLTSVGLVMGTPGYLSPEVVEGAAVTPATDWWGWAATLAFAATGRPPFGRGPMDVVLARVRNGEFDLRGVDPRLEPLLAAALSPVPAHRPPAQLVMSALERFAAGGAATAVLPVAATTPMQRFGGPGAPPATRHTEVVPFVPRAGGSVPIAPPTTTPPPPPPMTPGPAGSRSSLPPGLVEPAWPPTAGMPVPAGDPMGGPVAPMGPDDGPGQPDPRIGRANRSGTLAALAAALAALTALAPVVAVLVAVGWSWLARTVDRSMTSSVLRRFEYGRRRGDAVRALVAAPWHLVAGALATVLALLLPLLVGIAGVYCAALALTATTGGNPAPGTAVCLAAGGLVAAMLAWWGPGGTSVRRGSRSVLRGIAPGRLGADVLVGVLLGAVVGLAVWAYVRHGQPFWWPLPGIPDWLRTPGR